MKPSVHSNLREKSLKINRFFRHICSCAFLCLFLCFVTGCSNQNQISELFDKWCVVDDAIAQQAPDIMDELEIFLHDYDDFKSTAYYKNLLISEDYGSALVKLDEVIQKGDINQIRAEMFRLVQMDNFLTHESNLEYLFLVEGMLVFSVIISILLYIIFRNYEKRKKEAKQLGIYSDFMIKGMESERTRISKEIHDTILQDLKVLSLKTEMLDTDSVKDEKQKAELKADLISQTNLCIKRLRSICNDLTPVEFKNPKKNTNGFIMALQSMTEQFMDRTKTNCILKIQEELDISSLTLEQTINIFRIIQEALNNVEKHAEATTVSVIITNCQDGEGEHAQRFLKIFITDNGKGFDSRIFKDNNFSYGHFGLYNMKERAKDSGAEIDIISEEGEGTEIKLEVPLK